MKYHILFVIFEKQQIKNFRLTLLQIVGGALWVNGLSYKMILYTKII